MFLNIYDIKHNDNLLYLILYYIVHKKLAYKI